MKTTIKRLCENLLHDKRYDPSNRNIITKDKTETMKYMIFGMGISHKQEYIKEEK